MKTILTFLILPMLVFNACNWDKTTKITSLTEQQVVDGMINLYAIDAKLNEFPSSQVDSLRTIYLDEYFAQKGYEKSTFDANMRELQNFPDSLNILQSRALDTIRVLMERSYQINTPPAPQVN